MKSAAALSTAVDVCCCSLATRRPLIASKARFLMYPSSTTLVRNLIASVTTATDSSDSACTAKDAAQLGRNPADNSHELSGSAPMGDTAAKLCCVADCAQSTHPDATSPHHVHEILIAYITPTLDSSDKCLLSKA